MLWVCTYCGRTWESEEKPEYDAFGKVVCEACLDDDEILRKARGAGFLVTPKITKESR